MTKTHTASNRARRQFLADQRRRQAAYDQRKRNGEQLCPVIVGWHEREFLTAGGWLDPAAAGDRTAVAGAVEAWMRAMVAAEKSRLP